MEDFASTALYNLVATQLGAAGINTKPSQQFEGKIESTRKADLLAGALGSSGASSIVAIGQAVRELGTDPTLAVLLRAGAPGDLLQRWHRLERYYHGKHRTRVLDRTERSTLIEHYAIRAKPPSAGEDLLIAGLLAALLQAIGCRGLSLGIGDRDNLFIDKDQMVDRFDTPRKTSTWMFEWRSFVARNPHLGVNLTAKGSPASVSDQLSWLMADDLGRNWRLGMAAEYLAMSGRSLQRSLAKEGKSFQKLLREVRVDRSAALISSGDLKLAEAGYACGFSDQAHFSREFKLRLNMTPSQFADMSVPD